jgi:hypothetical protein
MSFPTSYVKLDDGSWGLRIPPSATPFTPGQVISVTTRSGQVKSETLGAYQGKNKYGDQLWSIVKTAPAQATLALGDLGGVLALFAKAKTHLKYPAIVLSVPEIDNTMDVEGFAVRLSLASERAKVPGSITVTENDRNTTNDYGEPAREWLGRVLVDGTYQPARAANGRAEPIARRLAELARDPAKVAAEHGKLTGRCCFCNRALSDERSTAVGYGQTCAGHFGVAWGSKPSTFAGEAV